MITFNLDLAILVLHDGVLDDAIMTRGDHNHLGGSENNRLMVFDSEGFGSDHHTSNVSEINRSRGRGQSGEVGGAIKKRAELAQEEISIWKRERRETTRHGEQRKENRKQLSRQ